ncbi:hypothetical protein CLF_100911, partial [Clonorchis sinensis]
MGQYEFRRKLRYTIVIKNVPQCEDVIYLAAVLTGFHFIYRDTKILFREEYFDVRNTLTLRQLPIWAAGRLGTITFIEGKPIKIASQLDVPPDDLKNKRLSQVKQRLFKAASGMCAAAVNLLGQWETDYLYRTFNRLTGRASLTLTASSRTTFIDIKRPIYPTVYNYTNNRKHVLIVIIFCSGSCSNPARKLSNVWHAYIIHCHFALDRQINNHFETVNTNKVAGTVNPDCSAPGSNSSDYVVASCTLQPIDEELVAVELTSVSKRSTYAYAKKKPIFNNVIGLQKTVVDQKYDLTTLSWLPPMFPGRFMIALDACKKEAPIAVKIVRVLAMSADLPSQVEDYAQPMVLILHTLLDGMNDLFQVEQGGTIKVGDVNAIPFYFYFNETSVEADKLIALVKKIMEVASGLADEMKALLIPTVYVQQCENTVDAYPVEVVNFKAELKTTPEMERLLNAEEQPNKELEASLRADIKALMKGKFPGESIYKSTTVDYLVYEGGKLSVAFHVNFDGYRIAIGELDAWKNTPVDSTLLIGVTAQ